MSWVQIVLVELRTKCQVLIWNANTHKSVAFVFKYVNVFNQVEVYWTPCCAAELPQVTNGDFKAHQRVNS